MSIHNLIHEKNIRYQGQIVRVVVECTPQATFFLVYLPGEEGHLRIHVVTDKDGNETWLEGTEATERAAHIGQLLEAEA